MEITSNSTLEETLNAFIADEHIASTQYKMAKVVAKGKALNFADKIFGENGDEEDEHFDELVTYAQSLNIPVQVNPSQMEVNCTTPFVDVTDGDSTAQLVQILISAEKKAIGGYETALRNEAIIAEHPELTQFFGELLNDERVHLKELEDVMSNIEASNIETASATMETEPIQVITASEPDTTVVTAAFGESVERSNTIRILESLKAGRFDSEALLRNLLTYMVEESVCDVVEMHDYFDTETAKLAYGGKDDRCCSHVIIEMVEDGMLESERVAVDMLDSMNDDDVGLFAASFGYVNDAQSTETETPPTMLSESSLSFQDIFNKVIS